MLNKEENNETIDVFIQIRKVEILLAVLKFSLTYCLSQSAIADLFIMLNYFFGVTFLPSTRCLVDQLFNTESGIEYHAVCPTCKKYVGKFQRRDRHIRCNNCESIIQLKDPIYNEFFAIINVDNEIANLIEENHEYYDKIVLHKVQNYNDYGDITDGELYKQFVNSLTPNNKFDFATCVFNTDGSPVFKSSKCSIWPIQMILNELPYDVRTVTPLVCGICFGKDKPVMNIFFKSFISYINKLSESGIK